MLMTANIWRRIVLLGIVACLYGCMEVEQRVQVNEDGSISLKVIMKIDPQDEAAALAALREELTTKKRTELPAGTRVDFSQRVDGKAAVIMEVDGASALEMLQIQGATTITVRDGGFMKKRYEYKETVAGRSEVPFRAVIRLPGSIESVTGGKKTADDTAEFDLTHANKGDKIAVTSTAFTFNLGSVDTATAAMANTGTTTWLMPASIGSIFAGMVLLLTGWFRSRKATRAVGARQTVAAPTPAVRGPNWVDEVASVFCTECGAPNAAGRKFCSTCGHTLG